jgi:hypothetical protein
VNEQQTVQADAILITIAQSQQSEVAGSCGCAGRVTSAACVCDPLPEASSIQTHENTCFLLLCTAERCARATAGDTHPSGPAAFISFADSYRAS